MKANTWEGTFEIKHRTDNAVLVIDPASDEEVWIPNSQIEEIHGIKGNSTHFTIVMSSWIAQKKGFL